ncbi:MAG TPA: hypothetical protein VFX39_10295 [Gemmatimonadaceae bacterium]|nr:hypothetical protein [Gemmatimonadaceae bacterium]
MPERLAALADGVPPGETPSAWEARHLADCDRCRRELDAHRVLLEGARLERHRVGPPLTDWTTLAGALRAEGLLRQADDAVAATPDVIPLRPATTAAPARRVPRWAGRAAAALLLAGGGLVAGRVSAGAHPVPDLAGLASVGRLGGSPSERAVAAILADSAPPPASTDEAMAILTRAERDYRLATAYLADETAPQGAEADRPEVYQRRLAVMDEVASLTRAALTDAPHDPVLNQYYLASLGAREATLRHLATALPTGAQLSRF